MKKVFLLIMVAATMLFTQCKKNEIVKPTGGNTVEISLTLDNNSKVIVDPNSADGGNVTFEKDDKIYVAYNGKYVGELTKVDSKFSGTITVGDSEPKDQCLYFYFLGNKKPSETLKAGSTPTLTVDISNQLEKLPVISFGKSDQKYPANDNKYTSVLQNKCALVQFNANNVQYDSILVMGLKNSVSVNLTNNGFSYSGNSGITLNKLTTNKTTEYWAILLPGDNVGKGTVKVNNNVRGFYFGNIENVQQNALYNNTTEKQVNMVFPSFTVDASGNKVFFSPGNLYHNGDAQTDSDYFHFEANQWEFNPNVAENSEDDWLHKSRFKWLGKNKMLFAKSNSYTKMSQLFCKSNFSCEGIDGWRTLSFEEFKYLMNVRSASTICEVSNARYMFAKVADVAGIMLFPDEFNGSIDNKYASHINKHVTDISASISELPEFDENSFRLLESKGVIFLPSVGTYNYNNLAISGQVIYHTSTGDENGPNVVAFSNVTNDSGENQFKQIKLKYDRCAIRLVTDIINE